MASDDLDPQNTQFQNTRSAQRSSLAESKDLDALSIEAIGAYIEDLKTEIVRAEAAVLAKQAARAGADAFFKS